MSTFSKAAIFAAIFALLASFQAFGGSVTPQLGGGIGNGFDGGISGKATAVGPQPSGSALLADNTNSGLLADNVNPACLAGGC